MELVKVNHEEFGLTEQKANEIKNWAKTQIESI